MAEAAPIGRGRLRRLFGLDRSGPPPRQTLEGEPLSPLTVPNLVGYLRLAGIPLYLVLAFESADGRSAAAAAVFASIAVADYLDGFLARATGQYSRLGALLDPLVDRLMILSGGVVCWYFELLPRWALALLVARELLMLALAQYGLRHGARLAINWPGRISVFPLMAGLFLALLTDGWLPPALLIAGLALAVLASALYARAGLTAVRAARAQAGAQAP